MNQSQPIVVIIGGGFGGLAAAKALARTPAQVVLIDRNNHHVFQPLLYQVATSTLSPAHIGSPLRSILGKHKNITVVMGEVSGVNPLEKYVLVSDADRANVPIYYDYLILATGATHNYFGHDEFRKYAPGLKNLAGAVAIRNKILGAFELAEAEEDPGRHRDLLTVVLVGAGPTGVELAGALAHLVRTTLRSQFRRIDPATARIVLVDRGKRVLSTFSEDLSKAAQARLSKLGVEIRLGKSVDLVDAEGVVVAGERIASKTVIWTAGVTPSPAGQWLKAETDHAGRVRVQQDLSVLGTPEIFVVGDTATLDQNGKPLPGVAQVAMQQGRYAARVIAGRIVGGPPLKPFRYFDKGNMAVVGKNYAVLESGPVRISGPLACLAWALVHLQFLAQPNLRVGVFLQWIWTYLSGQRGSRLIVNHQSLESTSAATQPAELLQLQK